MPETSSAVYAASDLGGPSRSAFDAARAGVARVLDSDGTQLVLLSEARLEGLEATAQWATQVLAIEALLRKPPDSRTVADFREAPWLQVFDDDDLATFVEEVGQALLQARESASTETLDHLVEEWRITAEVLSDPGRRDVLLGPHDINDFVEVRRPE